MMTRNMNQMTENRIVNMITSERSNSIFVWWWCRGIFGYHGISVLQEYGLFAELKKGSAFFVLVIKMQIRKGGFGYDRIKECF